MDFANAPLPVEARTRFLYPFFIERGRLTESVNTIASIMHEDQILWREEKAHDEYRSEIHDSVIEYLFGSSNKTACRYLVLNSILAETWFAKTRFVFKTLNLALTEPAIELFLTNDGVGVLSITLEPKALHNQPPLDNNALTMFNYQLASRRKEPNLRFPHPTEDKVRWRKMKPEQQASVPAPVDPRLPLLQRIGREGVAFSLHELIEGDCQFYPGEISSPTELVSAIDASQCPRSQFLSKRYSSVTEASLLDWLNHILNELHPLADGFPLAELSEELRERALKRPRGEERRRLNRDLMAVVFPKYWSSSKREGLLEPLRPFGLSRAQDRLTVFTSVVYPQTVDFGEEARRDSLSAVLSLLAQVEESSHAGAIAGNIAVPNSLLSRKHWAAASTLGGAHLLANQDEDIEFNNQRLGRVHRKYFIPFVLALLQRWILQRLADEAGDQKMNPKVDTGQAIVDRKLRVDFLDFLVHGYFPVIGTRDAHNHWYSLCQQAFRVEPTLATVRTALEELETRRNDDLILIAMEATRTATAQSQEILSRVEQLAKDQKSLLLETKDLQIKSVDLLTESDQILSSTQDSHKSMLGAMDATKSATEVSRDTLAKVSALIDEEKSILQSVAQFSREQKDVLHTTHEMHRKMGYLECFIFAAYILEMLHIGLGDKIHHDPRVLITTICIGTCALVVASLVIISPIVVASSIDSTPLHTTGHPCDDQLDEDAQRKLPGIEHGEANRQNLNNGWYNSMPLWWKIRFWLSVIFLLGAICPWFVLNPPHVGTEKSATKQTHPTEQAGSPTEQSSSIPASAKETIVHETPALKGSETQKLNPTPGLAVPLPTSSPVKGDPIKAGVIKKQAKKNNGGIIDKK